MLAKRIIPCLDVKDGTTVKGVNFTNLKDAGDPVALGKRYCDEGADELVFLDITASYEKRKTFANMVMRVAENINIPFTVGGGISSVEDVERLLEAGADKVSINSAALKNPNLIDEIARNFGNQVCVLAIDAHCIDDEWICYINGGRIATHRKLFEWAREGQERGAGEILLTSMNQDGEKSGFDLALTKAIHDAVTVPVIASGGAGNAEHFREVLQDVDADAALAASIFHYKETSVAEVKSYLKEKGVHVR